MSGGFTVETWSDDEDTFDLDDQKYGQNVC